MIHQNFRKRHVNTELTPMILFIASNFKLSLLLSSICFKSSCLRRKIQTIIKPYNKMFNTVLRHYLKWSLNKRGSVIRTIHLLWYREIIAVCSVWKPHKTICRTSSNHWALGSHKETIWNGIIPRCLGIQL